MQLLQLQQLEQIDFIRNVFSLVVTTDRNFSDWNQRKSSGSSDEYKLGNQYYSVDDIFRYDW